MISFRILGSLALLILVVALAWWQRDRLDQPPPTEPPAELGQTESTQEETTPDSAGPSFTRFYAARIEGVGSAFQLSAEVPGGWEAEWVANTEAINLFDPAAGADSNLERSQIFIRFFTATQFLTLTSVTILSRTETMVDGRPAVRYEIEKNPRVAEKVDTFTNQPSWRRTRHNVTDVRVSDDSPSIFYVIAKRPDLDQGVYDHVLETLRVIDVPPTQSAVVEPVDSFAERITKKPFGIKISPDSSPVLPERFSGYHTGADAEFDDVSGDVEVRSIAAGTVRIARTADGYGGVVVIEQVINGTTYQVVYGHLDPTSLPAVGSTVEQNERIGHLGEGGTTETDGERKHLHLGVYKGSDPNLRGYVSTEAELEAWLDPRALF
ncbi:M23 family metallopeptidase [Candidatus Berkelbacteria bacterium]|nr:M23 family metallopeptidase [Candidatus Berkelbacteria bacterium]